MQTITPPAAPAPSIRRKQPHILTVLTVLALAVAAGVWWFGLRDSGSDITPVTVEGTSTCTETSDSALRSSGVCTDTMSDPRVSGTAIATARIDTAPPTAMDGTYELTNDNGTWVGDWSGEITADGNHIIDGLYIGSGDYEGLQYRQHVEGVNFPWTITGTIEASP